MEVCGLVEVDSTPEEDLWLVGLGGGNQGGEPSLQESLWFRHLTSIVFLSLCQGCISCGPCSYPELTEDHVLPSAQVKIFRTVTRNAVNKSV